VVHGERAREAPDVGLTITVPEGAETPSFTPVERGSRLLVVALACVISVFLDQATGGVTQAVQPYMQGTAGASVDEGTWLAISYNTCYYLSLIASPWMIARFTRRTVWIGGHAVFAAACFGIAASQSSLDGMVALRALQGLGQGTFFLCAAVTVLTVFPPAIRFLGLAILGTTSLSGPAEASAIGGFFVDANDWTLAFVTIAVLATIASVLVAFVLRDPPQARDLPRLDTIGMMLALLHYFTYHYVSQYGERRDWFGDPSILAMSAIFVIATMFFVARELRSSWPFIPVALFDTSHNRSAAGMPPSCRSSRSPRAKSSRTRTRLSTRRFLPSSRHRSRWCCVHHPHRGARMLRARRPDRRGASDANVSTTP
jgi:MFS transporter, DHA2 family, multidrug resistance protein